MYNKTMSRTLKKDQRGLVSFMITLIMMLVISLIVIGFTQVTNRNRREQLDRQLSMQAFYAAESGVNAAATKINTDKGTPGGVVPQDTCNGSDYSPTNLVADGSVGYTCVLVNPTVPQITTSANSKTSAVIDLDLRQSNGSNFPTGSQLDLSFTWSVAVGGKTDASTCANPGTLPTTVAAPASSCGYAVLRIDLMKIGGALNATSLSGDTVTYYMQPRPGSGSSPAISDFTSKKAYLVAAACDSAKRTCTGTISLSGTAKTTNYYARISTLYQDTARLVIDGKNSIGNSAYFANAQAIVDVTGKAQDVLRRVQVTVPLQARDSTLIPQAAAQSTADVCKQFSTYPGYYNTACP
jgi:Tfp pilus assembly protein PilX